MPNNPRKFNITIIGSGNVGYHIAVRLHAQGHRIVQVYSRSNAHATSLAQRVNAQVVTSWSDVSDAADVYVVAVPDNTIESVYINLPISNKTMLHTAASVSCKISSRDDLQHGVLYPLQSFNRAMETNWNGVPILVDGENEAVLRIANTLAESLSGKAFQADDSTRLKIHTAAVFANNFSNRCIAIAERLLSENKLDFDLLRPLLETTFSRLQHNLPAEVQTGPALRHDTVTMNKHLLALHAHPRWTELYQLMSEDIQTAERER